MKTFLIAILGAAIPLSFTSVLSAMGIGGPIRARVVFIGDIMVHGQQLEAARHGPSWDFKPQFQRVKPLFRKSLAVGNLETVLAGPGKKFTGYPAFNAPDELAAALADLGLDIALLANNHILDQGFESALRTTKVLNDAGLVWTGLSPRDDPGAPLVIEYAGLRWAFINHSYGSNNNMRPPKTDVPRLNLITDEAIVSSLKRAAALKPDITVAFLHWGAEYQYSPSKSQRLLAALCLKNGADLVIGAHPHVLQPVEVMKSDHGYGVVAYSLGNFISSQRKKPRERSVVLAVDVEKKPWKRAVVSRVSIAPTWVSAGQSGGRRKFEVVYAGGGPFEQAGLPAGELLAAGRAGGAVLDFLGASPVPDRDGFHQLWDSSSPDAPPKSRRTKPE